MLGPVPDFAGGRRTGPSVRRIGIGLLGCGLAFAALGGTVSARNAEVFFDQPLKVVHRPLPRDPDNPQAKPEVRCTYYARFVVKEIDLGEEGAFQLSILPANGTTRACRKENAADEKIVSPGEWTGYFKGAVGDYIFFDAEDGWNGGLGFAVFTPDARKLFDDVAKKWLSIAPSGGASGNGLTLRYLRVFGAKCSLGDQKAQTCWRKIETATGLDCRALYAREQRRTPKFAKQVLEDPSAVEYDAVTVLTGKGATTTAMKGSKAMCRPQD